MCTKINSVVTISALSVRSDALTANFELKYCLSDKSASALKIKSHTRNHSIYYNYTGKVNFFTDL